MLTIEIKHLLHTLRIKKDVLTAPHMFLTHISRHRPRVQQCAATVNKALEEQTHSVLHTKECGLWVVLLS